LLTKITILYNLTSFKTVIYSTQVKVKVKSLCLRSTTPWRYQLN